jgi:acyl-CoA hydrolase
MVRATAVSCRAVVAVVPRPPYHPAVHPSEAWRERAVPASQAVAAIRPGARVFVGSACATPRALLAALEARAGEVEGVELIHFLTDGAVRDEAGVTSAFTHRAWYVGRDMRNLAGRGRLEYVPVSLASVPDLLAAGRLAFDVALIQVTPPDDDGMCSLGVSVDVTRARRPSPRTTSSPRSCPPCRAPVPAA